MGEPCGHWNVGRRVGDLGDRKKGQEYKAFSLGAATS